MKKTYVAVAAVFSAASIAACSSSGPHVTSTSPLTSNSVTGTPSSSSVRESSPRTSGGDSSPATSDPSNISTPSVTPGAQPAVNAYIAGYVLTTRAYADPSDANLATLARYEAGAVLAEDESTLKELAGAGIAYRGIAAIPHPKVVSASPTSVTLTDCGTLSKRQPYEQYYVKTGKPVPASVPAVPPPYLKVLTMQKAAGQWKLVSIATRANRTCTP